ncbi:hypothetical protein H2203_007116 [Taxawa tesnikishii (nom. ined.)]|nr:hypothetical protein H2203_007116 [Dothideales sp. JES 119]
MSDEDVATKAPESDAQENTPIAGDSVVDQGASLGEHGQPERHLQAFVPQATPGSQLQVYITKPADYPHSPSKLLLFLTGGTGIHSTNNQLQADKYASEGFLVVMPDQFNGDTAPNTNTTIHSESSPSFIERVKLGIAEAAKSFQIDMWLARHTPATVLPHLHRLLAALRDEFADAVANGDGIYAVGYSFGAKYVLLLGSDLGDEMATGQREGSQESKAEEGKMKGPAIKVGALAHGIIDREDFVHLKVPVGMVCVEGDPLFSDEAREEGSRSRSRRAWRLRVGCTLVFRMASAFPVLTISRTKVANRYAVGFAVVGHYDDPKIQDSQKKAFDQMLGWLKSH